MHAEHVKYCIKTKTDKDRNIYFGAFQVCFLKKLLLSLYYFLVHLLPQLAAHTLSGQAVMQSSSVPGHPPGALPPDPPRAYNIAGVVLMVLSSPMLPGCLVVVLVLVVLGCLVVFLPLFPPPGAPSPE